MARLGHLSERLNTLAHGILTVLLSKRDALIEFVVLITAVAYLMPDQDRRSFRLPSNRAPAKDKHT
jgi:hypothetical protein